MAESYLEREQKYDAPPDLPFPDIPGALRRTAQLRATYYDTDDALLQARGVVLRRRAGGSDEGWHLKVPHAEGKLELRCDLAPAQPPGELAALTRGLRFDRPLHPRALLRTSRNAYRLHTADGELIAEVADDRVEATVMSTGDTRHWREIEVELGPAGTADDGDDLAQLLTAAGATSSAHGSKLAHAVGEPSERPSLSALAGLVDDYLRAQYERLAWGDFRLRRGENAVHKTRVAVRRIRSTLRIFAPLFDAGRAAHLDRELSWYAGALGEVRDRDIVRARVGQHLQEDPDRLLPEGAAGGLLRLLEREREQARQDLMALLDGRRYGALLQELHSWRREAPVTGQAMTPAESVEGYVLRAQKKSDKRLARAAGSDEDTVDAALHRARKAAKRTRYAAELARPAMGKPAKRIARSHEKRQEELGVFQDHVTILGILRHTAATKGAGSDTGFVCGVLAQRHSRAKRKALKSWH